MLSKPISLLPAGFLLILGFLFTSCVKQTISPNMAETEGTDISAQTNKPATLTVMAAASLSDSFEQIGDLFEAANPGVTILFNFAGSQQLAQQMDQGAQADVFASANWKQMEAVVNFGLIEENDPLIFAENRLVVIFPMDNLAGIHGLSDLAKDNLKIVFAAQEVPVGQYTLEFLEKAATEDAFGRDYQAGVLANVVSNENNVKAVLAKVALGEADAGIVYSSDVVGPDSGKVGQIEIPEALNVIATYPIAVLKDTDHPDLAQQFVDFVLSSEGQAVLAAYGFVPAIDISTPDSSGLSGLPALVDVPWHGLTHIRLDGNRLAQGAGGMPSEPVDIQLNGIPVWITGAPLDGGSSVWLVLLETGQVQSFLIQQGTVNTASLELPALAPGMPPALIIVGEDPSLLVPPQDASQLTSPIRLGDGRLVYLDQEGRLHLDGPGDRTILATRALPDARILSDGAGRLLFLSQPTDSYAHGVLGDPLEAQAFTLIDLRYPEPEIQEMMIEAADVDVIEGIAPIWADLDGDGVREIIVTQSNPQTGARIVVYEEDGQVRASSDPIGQGFRWRHQLAVGPFGPDGETELAVVRTPHIGGLVEFFQIEGKKLQVVATASGYSSHRIGSRNLDGGLAGDFNGDGQVELVVPDQAQQALVGLQRTAGGVEPVWRAALDGRLSTNLNAVTLPGGRLALAAGIENGVLQIWLPESSR